MLRDLDLLPDYVYPADPWRIVEKRFYPKLLPRTETLFATANGYFGMRGTFDEGAPSLRPGTIINGFHETWPIVYGEEAFGFAKTGQTIVNVPDATQIRLYVDDEPFYLPTAVLRGFERVLDMRAGSVNREVVWATAAGKHVTIRSRRLVSFPERHLAAISYEIVIENADAPVVISSELRYDPPDAELPSGDPRKRPLTGHVLVPRIHSADERRLLLAMKTRNSEMRMAAAVEHDFETKGSFTEKAECGESGGAVVFSVDAKQGEPICLTKLITYHSSTRQPAAELVDRAHRTLDRARRHGFVSICEAQREYVDDFWRRSDVQTIGADPRVQQAARFSLYQILQASARAEGTGVPAKGLTGEGYEGHYFWDTEIYLLPFLIYTAPRIARNLLQFRAGMLDAARARAREVNQRGALFPWRTINGEEASAYYAAGTAQYHINADVVYAMRKYVQATGDEDFLYRTCSDVLVETARLWLDLGFFSEKHDGRFCIHGVTGPDEYNTVVNNSTFTNLMARENLWYASEVAEEMRQHRPDRYEALVDRTGLQVEEIAAWRRAANRMYVPYDEKTQIHLQDDAFADRQPWDFEGTPPEKYPLLLHFHPLVIYRHKVIKQADVVLAMFLLGDEFTPEEKKRNFDYYDPLTTGDSTLSSCIQAIMAHETGAQEKAREYARHALLMDLADVAGNVEHGCHIASMGGSWLVIVYGIAGFRDHGGRFSFSPRRPAEDLLISCRITLRGNLISIDLRREGVVYTLEEGDGVEFFHFDELIELTPADPVAGRDHAHWSEPLPVPQAAG